MAAWSGWGGLSPIFDESKDGWEPLRGRLRGLLDEDAYRDARAGVLNAHYSSPVYAQAIWKAVTRLGITSGEVLEPGCGSGTFIASAPNTVHMTGVEIDSTTAAITQALYPGDQILAEGFETTRVSGNFDAAVGNVPFGDIRLHDPVSNPGNHSIHNHFIIKSLDQVKPGGIVAVLTSSYTLDAGNPAARRDMAERADLLGALRLPSAAHKSVANTEVVTDLLIFRKRKDGEDPQPFNWEHSTPVTLPGKDAPIEININTYFQDHPANMLGTVSARVGLYGALGLHIDGPADTELASLLETHLTTMVEDATKRGLLAAPVQGEPIRVAVAPTGTKQLGHIEVGEDSSFTILTENGWEDLSVPSTQTAELGALLELRDQTRHLIEQESANRADTPELTHTREVLRETYLAYAAKYGPINRITKTARLRDDGSETVSTRRPPVMRFFNRDPFSPLTRAIERFDEDTDQSSAAPILTSRQILARYTPKGADTAADAIAISLTTNGRVDVDYCAWLLGTSVEETRPLMNGLVFDTGDGTLVPRAEYLSGNVRRKLATAQALAMENPQFQDNVDALTNVIPKDLGIQEITPALGVSWITPADHQEFAHHLFRTKNIQVDWIPSQGWSVKGGSSNNTPEVTTWGTPQMIGSHILRALLTNSEVVIRWEDEDGKQYVDVQATAAAQAKAEAIEVEFARWVWQDPTRADRVIRVYNDRFNSLVPRSYDDQATGLRLPGLALSFDLHPHQLSAVARMIAEPTTGLFHEVGAGKTLEMVCGVMEQNRLGLINKPMVVVPNHMLSQFEREWLQAYPASSILAADTTDIGSKSGRGDFMARVTTGNWDAVICTQSAFERIRVLPETYEMWAKQEMVQLEGWIKESQKMGESISVRNAEKRLANLKAKIARQRSAHESRSDGGVSFEALGVDYLVVDEAHAYKNLAQPTNIRGVITTTGSARASDLDMKLDWLRQTHGDRVATFATATPIANTMGEMWVMMHYLRPDLLEDAGLATFDHWAANFTTKVQKVETGVTGKVEVKTRIAKFRNLPDLMSMWSVFADVKTAADLNLPTPNLVSATDGSPTASVVTVNIGEAMGEFNAHLMKRAELIKSGAVDRTEDNWLSLSSDGKGMALDHRLFTGKRRLRALDGVESPIPVQKVDHVADQVYNRWVASRGKTYLDDSGIPSTTPGALQLVFCDQSTPKGQDWSFYQELKDQLVLRGMPAEKIVFAHEGKTVVEKDRIFARARSGSIAVLVGSTEKMGTGANMQARALALHHVDAPWRPADLTQRDGRIIRQGNQNPEVEILRYVTESSFDTYSWQTLERKISFINQIMSGKYAGREADDISDDEASYAQVKAIASGNPLIVEEARLQNEVSKYQSRSTAFGAEQDFLQSRLQQRSANQRDLVSRLGAIDKIVPLIRPTTGDLFRATIDGRQFTKRADATDTIGKWAYENYSSLKRVYASNHPHPLYGTHTPEITVGGLTFEILVAPKSGAATSPTDPLFMLRISNLERSRDTIEPGVPVLLSELLASGPGLMIRLENHVQSIAEAPSKGRQQLAGLKEEIDNLRSQIGLPNPWTDKLTDSKTQLAQVRKDMARLDSQKPATGPNSGPGEDMGAATTPAALRRIQSIAEATTPSPQQTISTTPGSRPGPPTINLDQYRNQRL